jgi:hypothetical protein
MEFEDEFDMSIPDEEAEKIQKIGQAIDYIETHMGKSSEDSDKQSKAETGESD